MLYGWNRHTSGESNDLYDIGALDYSTKGEQEGIVDGLILAPVSSSDDQVELSAGVVRVNMGDYRTQTYLLPSGTTLDLADATSGTTNYIAAEIDVTNATAEIIVSDTLPVNTPSPEVYYTTLYEVEATGVNLVGTDISKVGSVVNNGWYKSVLPVVFGGADSGNYQFWFETVAGDVTDHFVQGTKVKVLQSGTYRYFAVGYVTPYNGTLSSINLFGGNNQILANATIDELYICHGGTPLDWPDMAEWTLINEDSGSTQNTPTPVTVYNLGGSINIPPGAFQLNVTGMGSFNDNGVGLTMTVGLGTATNSFLGFNQYNRVNISVTQEAGTVYQPYTFPVAIVSSTNYTTATTVYVNCTTGTTGTTNIGLDDIRITATPLFV